ncbi:MAG: hypothetical protein L0I94_11030 [Yaniella sp.]|nr:hypothetical protein [Yaniella sp.]MDN5732441.1 hypothetical protein [Yaniella sp.]MDN5818835.1 hypothetical protein [Yaniella sp.]MDN5913355.1 hypothetical protein [Yaniella sp.]MDN6149345.1 hypothetical protein [Yaniella sp.]MDN6151542.1 hypothetical protein [Yaniella sp.]
MSVEAILWDEVRGVRNAGSGGLKVTARAVREAAGVRSYWQQKKHG